MRKILVGIILSLVCILSFCQERIDTNTSLHFSKTTKTLNTIIGYNHYNKKWYNEKNEIPHSYYSEAQKFKKLTVKSLTYNDTLYYVLIRNFDEYAERYPSLGFGGGNYINYDILFFFTAPEFEQIFQLNKTAKLIYSFRKFETANILKRSNLSDISIDVLDVDKNRKETPMIIRIADDGMMIRFLLPDQTLDEKNDILKSKYFEISLKKFYDWLKPITPQEIKCK